MEQPIIAKARTRRTQQQISDLLGEFDKADCTVKEFCQFKGISQGNFHKWKSRRNQTSLQKIGSSSFAKIHLNPSSSDHLFAEVNGIRFYQAVSAAYLKEIIG